MTPGHDVEERWCRRCEVALLCAAALAPGGFLKQAVGENVVQRFLTGTDHARSPLFYLVDLPGSFLP